MRWNWQQDDWPLWRHDDQILARKEELFLLHAGRLTGVWSHLAEEDRAAASVEIVTAEAMKTSEIEGEYLDRASVQSSVRRAFGLNAERRRGAAESGIADMLTDGFATGRVPLDEETLFRWHRMVCRGRDDLRDPGGWRRGGDPMQVVSGPLHRPRVHFEAPPADRVASEMARFVAWFNATAPGAETPVPALARAGLAHLHFVSVHPFEDGNGRIARALSEKALAQAIGHPSLAALSVCIGKARAAYYQRLEANNNALEVTDWLDWFAGIVLEAQSHSLDLVDHLILKTRTMDRLRGQINERQTRALLRLFDAGPEGFEGGMSAANYTRITGASPATARRDLAALVELGALDRSGERRGTRYRLKNSRGGDDHGA